MKMITMMPWPFDDSGIELERTRYWINSEERTLIFSVKTETGVSKNTLFSMRMEGKSERYSQFEKRF